jgi:hypothetical protein
MVSSHGVQGNVHRKLLLYFGIKSKDGASFVFAATGTQAVGFLRLTALGAERYPGCLEGIVGTPLVSSGMRMSSFRQGHDVPPHR